MSEKKTLSREEIIKSYLSYLNEQRIAPRWVYKFIEYTKISKDNFYQFYSDLNDLENEIWSSIFQSTMEVLQTDPTYESFSLREKFLAFCYTLVEVMQDHRAALVSILQRITIPGIDPGYLKSSKTVFAHYADQLIKDGIQNGEIANRSLVNRLYPNMLWFQLLLLLRFWKNDKSDQLVDTDEAIERTVNLNFDLLEPGVVDQLPGYGRFLYKSWKKE